MASSPGKRGGFFPVETRLCRLCQCIYAHPSFNWLRVLDTAESSQVDQRVGHQLHAIMPLLDVFKTEEESFEFVLPRKGALDPHPQRMDHCVAEALPSTLRTLAVPRILWDVGDQA